MKTTYVCRIRQGEQVFEKDLKMVEVPLVLIIITSWLLQKKKQISFDEIKT